MKNFYRVYEFSHICSEENLPYGWDGDNNIIVKQTLPTGDEIVDLLVNDLESANYHSWTDMPRMLYKILLDTVKNEQTVAEIMRKIYEKGVFEV